MAEGALEKYPLTVPWLFAGTMLAMVIGVVSNSFLPAYAIIVLIAGIAITWRRGEAPIFAFVISYQWMSITIGYWYEKVYGFFPSTYRPGDIEVTVLLSLSGLLVLALGLRFMTWLVDRLVPAPTGRGRQELGVGNLKGLFLMIVVVYASDYVVVINPKTFGGFGAIVERVLDLRQVLLLVLWYEVLRQRTGFFFMWASLVWVFIPRLGAYYSDFKSPLIMLGIVLASSWRPWERHWWRRGLVTAVRGAPVAAALVLLVLVWQAGVKQETRRAYDRELVGRSPSERISFFLSNARETLPTVFEDTGSVVEGLVERLSYITFFSLTLDHVPAREPFAGGELLRMALVNGGTPRFLFPDKPVLPSDSYFTRRFTGIMVPDEATSISIGYMAEFYADWGLTGMFISVFGFGCWMALGAAAVRQFAGPALLANAVLIMVFLRVAEFETQFVKAFGGLNIAVIVILVMLGVSRGWIARIGNLVPVGSRPGVNDAAAGPAARSESA